MTKNRQIRKFFVRVNSLGHQLAISLGHQLAISLGHQLAISLGHQQPTNRYVITLITLPNYQCVKRST